MSRRRLGRRWELHACAFLRRHGVQILETGYQCRFGEIDIIGMDGQPLAIVEVRARGAGSIAQAIETVDANKRRKIILTARYLLMQRPEWSERPMRFDVVAIENIETARARVDWIRDAFSVEPCI